MVTLDWAKIKFIFGGKMTQAQVDGVNTILTEINREQIALKGHAAYIFATAFHETDRTMQPINERGGNAYLSKYDTGRLAKALGNTPEADGDGILYKGRGYVQLTGRANYEKFSKLLKAAGYKKADGSFYDLIKYPEQACDPIVAAFTLVYGMKHGSFTGVSMSKYIKAGPGNQDFVNARRIINGTDRAEMISIYAGSFNSAVIVT